MPSQTPIPPPPEDASSWWIGIEGWVLQDGNYTDFRTGDRRQFALEFNYNRSKRLRQTEQAAHRGCRHSGRGVTYDITGEVVHVTPEENEVGDAGHPVRDVFVIDFGLRAYKAEMRLDTPRPAEAGVWIFGEVGLWVDPFFYMEFLGSRSGMPPLIYTWEIEEIQRGVNSGENWITTDQTRTWDNAPYRLKCRLVNSVPSHSMNEGSETPTGYRAL